MIKLEFDINEVNMILQALGQRPFAEVNMLVGKIQQQALPQVTPPAPQEATVVTE
jgi:hypothetical protein